MRRVVFLLLIFSRSAEATTWYVAKTGSDSNSCAQAQSSLTPKLTITGASGGLSCVSASAGAGAGHTVEVAVGTYAEGLYGTMRSGTSFGSPFTLKAKSGDQVILRPNAAGGVIVVNAGQYWILEGFILDGDLTAESVVTVETSHARFLNCEVRDVQVNNGYILGTSGTDIQIVGGSIHDGLFTASGGNGKGYGVYIAGSGHLIDGVEIYNVQGYGIHVYDSNFLPSNNIIRNCIVHNTVQDASLSYQAGIMVSRGTNNQVYNNVSRNNGGHGIDIYSGQNHKIFHNTIYQNSQSAVVLRNNPGTTGHQIIDNIFYLNSTGTVINLCGAGCVTQSSNSTADPGFAGAPTNLQLTAGSNSIDNAVATTPSITTDLLGVSRPQGLGSDRGAYEFIGGTPSLSLLTPNGGQSWATGSSQTVTWGSVGSVGATVDINEDQDGNGSYETVIANDTANDGSFDFTVSGSANASRKMQICDSDGSPCDVSDAVYEVKAGGGGSITKVISNNSTGSPLGDINGVTDTEIWQVQPTLNQASATIMFSSKVDSSNHSYLLAFFPTSTIPASATVTSVTLGLYLDSSSCSTATAETFDIRRLLRTWIHPQATWNIYSTGNSWTTAGGIGAATDRTDTAVAQITGVTCTGGYYTVTQASGGLFDLVQDWIDLGATNQGLHIERNGTGNDGAYRGFISSEGTNGQRPYLSITYTTSTATITITQPTTGGHLFPGQVTPVRWTSQGVSGNFVVTASRNGGVTYSETISVSYPFDGSDLSWTIPAGPAASNCLVKVCSINDPTVCGVSDSFRIGGSTLWIK